VTAPRVGAAAAVLLALVGAVQAQAPNVPPLRGIYQAVGDDVVLAGRLRNAGSPEKVELLPAAVAQMKTVNLAEDPAKLCQPLGPFRMMARPGTKVEFVPARSSLVMIFEDIAHGLLRTIHLNRPHPASVTATWLGDSVGRWDGGTLVVDTVGFNDRTWLNDAGAQHSEAMHLVERVRPFMDGKYLEIQVTVEDPATLVKPYTYTRYFEKTTTEMMEDICEF
jgi:hypothetical protein